MTTLLKLEHHSCCIQPQFRLHDIAVCGNVIKTSVYYRVIKRRIKDI